MERSIGRAKGQDLMIDPYDSPPHSAGVYTDLQDLSFGDIGDDQGCVFPSIILKLEYLCCADNLGTYLHLYDHLLQKQTMSLISGVLSRTSATILPTKGVLIDGLRPHLRRHRRHMERLQLVVTM